MQQNNLPAYLFHQGTNYQAYQFLGAHSQKDHIVFRVFAPRADAVALVGDFNGWDDSKNPLVRITENGIWETKSF